MATNEEPPAEKVEKKPSPATLQDGRVVLEDTEDVKLLLQRGYGEKEKTHIELSPFEALYLLSEGWVEVTEKRSKLTFQELLTRFSGREPCVWSQYLIYRDLRERGYVVKGGFGLGVDFRVYERGTYGKSAAKYLVYGVFEGEPAPLNDLINALSTAQNAKKELILGVIERRGEIVYYSLSRFTLQEQ
ncbi:MAG: tRNA-intron lyase [Candidatus Bathyarchaeia archaeon]